MKRIEIVHFFCLYSATSGQRAHLQVDALQQLLHRGGLGRPALPPPPHGPLGLLLLLAQHVHVDELEGAHLVVQQAHPRPHGRLADDVDDVAALAGEKTKLRKKKKLSNEKKKDK